MNDHAIVIGGSVSGLLTARVLADHFHHVTLIERDSYPTQMQFRSGVPQGRHLHVLLMRGLAILRQLFPTIDADFHAAGAVELDLECDAIAYMAQGWLPRKTSLYHTFSSTRPLIDWVLTQRVRALPNVQIMERGEVIDLLSNTGHQRVTGVMVRNRETGSEHVMYADLVVDASGRSSRLPTWLEAMGYGTPQEHVVNSFLGYASRFYAPPSDWNADWKGVTIGAIVPKVPRGGIIFPVEGDQWLVTFGGAARDYPPQDEAGFMAFARGLAHPLIADTLERATPLSPIYSYRRTENRVLQIEQLTRLPSGFVALGDAVCAFNPIYGQGISSAAIAAELLGQHLSTGDRGSAMWSLDFQRSLAKQNAVIWTMATSEDVRYPTTEGGKPSRLDSFNQWYFQRVISIINRDAEAMDTLLRVIHLVDPPTALMKPRILRKAVLSRERPADRSEPPARPA